MTNYCLSSFQRKILCTTLICLTLLRSCAPRNPWTHIDFTSQALDPSATGFTINGGADGDRIGLPGGTAGDIDNDGYDDIIIGAYFKNGRQGAVYVIYGGEESTMSNIDLSTQTLDPLTTGFMLTGAVVYDHFGYSAGTAGDINGDGYADIIIGAHRNNQGRGIVYVIYGGPRSSMSNWDFSTGATLTPSATGFIITGNAADDYFGYSVSTAGDINKDGFDDIIIGAYWKNDGNGAAYVIYGGTKETRSNINLGSTTLSPASTGFTITTASRDNLGSSVSTAGDINGDTYADIIIGAPMKNSNKGEVYVIYGKPKTSLIDIDVSSISSSRGFTITGKAADDYFGSSVSTAGDYNNDGYDDIIIAAPAKNSNQGEVYVIYGGTSLSNRNLGSTTLYPTSTGLTITTTAADDSLGSGSAAGDINNDGIDDIIVAAFGKNTAYVIYGGSTTTRSNIALSSTLNPLTTGFSITTGSVSSWLGKSLSTGDFNKDGYDDLIVTAPQKDSARGTVYVIYGSCETNCKQCSSETVCTECKSPYLLYQGDCGTTCPIGTLKTTKTCEDCSPFCNKCPSSTSICTECQASYLMYKSECFKPCPDTTFADTTTTCDDCSDNNCKHCSSAPVCTECQSPYLLYKSECFSPCPNTTFADTAKTCADCPRDCNHCSSSSVCTECLPPLVLYDSQCLTSCPKAMFSDDNNECKDCPSYCSVCTSGDSCDTCYPGFTLSNSLCSLPVPETVPTPEPTPTPESFPPSSYQEAQERATQTVSSSARGISSMICVGSTVAPFSVLVSKIVQNTRFLNLTVSSDLSEIYKTWRTDLISWEVPNVFENEDNFEASPYLFAQYEIDSPFLVNFWPTLLNIAIGSGAFIAFIILQKIFELFISAGWIHSLMQKLIAGSFNFTLVQAYACMDDITLYLVIDARTNPLNSFFSWASIVSAGIFLAFGCLQVLFNVWTVKKYQSIKKQGAKEIEAFNEKNKYWELFYSDFNDGDLWSQSFFAILIIRSTFSNLIIVLLSDTPMIQTLCLMTLDGVIISFLYSKNPFNTLRGKLAQYYYEIITLLVHLCTFGLSLKDDSAESSDTIELIFSTAIIYLNTALISGSLGFMFIEIYKTISQRTKAAKLKQEQNKLGDTQEMQKLTQNASSLQPPETSGRKRPDWANQDQTASIDTSYYLPRGNKNGQMAIEDLNMESNRTRESNLNIDNSRDLDTRLTMTRRKLRAPNQRQHGISTVYPINN